LEDLELLFICQLEQQWMQDWAVSPSSLSWPASAALWWASHGGKCNFDCAVFCQTRPL